MNSVHCGSKSSGKVFVPSGQPGTYWDVTVLHLINSDLKLCWFISNSIHCRTHTKLMSAA